MTTSITASTPPFTASLRAALGVYIPWRILLSLWAAIVVWQFPVILAPGSDVARHYYEGVDDTGFVADYLIEPWLRWDAGWYTHIALHGYSDANPGATAFAPLYPALIGLLGRLLGARFLLAGLIISNLAAIGALTLLHRLVALHYSGRLANRTLIVLALYPGSFYLLAPFTESLCLLLVLGSFLAARNERWALAGLLGALAALTRWPGVLVALPLGWMFLEARRAGRSWQGWRQWAPGEWRRWLPALWLGLIPLAVLGTFAYFRFGINQPAVWESGTQVWQAGYTWPWHALARNTLAAAGIIDRLGSPVITLVSDSLVVVLFAALLLAGGRRGHLSIPLLLYGWGQLLLPTSRLVNGTVLNSLTRYVLLVFPAFIILAMLTARHRWLLRLLIIGGSLLGMIYSGMYFVWMWLA